MNNLSSRLYGILSKPCFDRPFVCDGPPEHAAVMIIGKNPAARLGVDWWSFWDDTSGFNINGFREVFDRKRLAGKRLRTRSSLDRLEEQLEKARVSWLETNVFRDEGDEPTVSNADVLLALIEELPKLRAIIAHGRIAQHFVGTQGMLAHVRTFGLRHFRTESHGNIDAVVAQIIDNH